MSKKTAIMDYMPLIREMMRAKPVETSAQLALSEEEIEFFIPKGAGKVYEESKALRDKTLAEAASSPAAKLSAF